MKSTSAKLGVFFSIAGRVSLVVLTALVLLSAAVNAQTTLFKFQAQLPNEVTPATDIYEMEFKLFDAATGGTQIGATNVVSAVDVKNRSFTVWLDFGATAFPGADRFIEIDFRRNNNQPFTTLAPREPVLSVPYSIRSLTATTADNALNLNGVSASNYVQTNDSRLSDERSPLPGSNNYIQNTTVQQAPANFNVSGSGAANIFNAAMQYNLGGERILSSTGGTNLFVGIGAGSGGNTFGNTFVGSNAGKINQGFSNTFMGRDAGMSNSSGSNNTFVGSLAGQANGTGFNNTFVGNGAGQTNTGGIQNAFFGGLAGFSNTTGKDNAFLGQSAGRANTNGQGNSFLGAFAGSGNTTGNFNTFVGVSAGSETTFGTENTFVGGGAGVNNTIGSGNTFVGYVSGFNSTTTTTISKNNTLLGNNTKINAGVFNSTGIGANVAVTTSNTIVLGTDSQSTYIPGGAVNTFNSNNYRGLIADNLIFRNLAAFIPTSSSPVCFRFTTYTNAAGNTDGGYGLTNCNSSSSSVAYKSEVEPFTSGLDVIKRLKPVSFKWKEGGKSDVGLNAEDVAEVAPRLATRNGKGEVEDVSTNLLNALFINAFKEQQTQIKAQQKQLDEQRQQINALTKLVCQMNAQTDVCKEK